MYRDANISPLFCSSHYRLPVQRDSMTGFRFLAFMFVYCWSYWRIFFFVSFCFISSVERSVGLVFVFSLSEDLQVHICHK